MFKRALRNIISWSKDEDKGYNEPSPYGNTTAKIRVSEDIDDMNNSLNFTIFNATGGKIVRIRTYDRKLDRSNSALHIITDKEDLGEELAQIITRENLTR